ncbi:glycosyltransferase family 2 protein [Vibrio olivae]|uniref:Glycosyltransferase family 2 protein n=1 Tax=Vibrio olivae TaxID=1243002 RepID=A0ABV5HR17_9VIBR
MIEKLNIIILNWNSAEDVKQLLESIETSTYKNFRLLLIHNATDDKSCMEEIYFEYKEKYETHIIFNEFNLGYAGGNNAGYKYLLEKKLMGNILILNPDITVRPNTIECLVRALNTSSSIGAAMIRTMNDNGDKLYDAIRLNGFYQKYISCNEEICETDYVAGSCFIIERELVDQIGLFDERYFMYWEEVDLSIRIILNGKKLVSTTKSHIFRKSNSSDRSANAIYFSARNSKILHAKFKDRFSFRYLLFYLGSSLLYSLFLSIKIRKLNPFLSFIRGVVSGI